MMTKNDDMFNLFDVNFLQIDNLIDWKSNYITFFNSKYENSIYINYSIVNIDRYVFYWNVYVFIDKLKKMTSLREKKQIAYRCFTMFT